MKVYAKYAWRVSVIVLYHCQAHLSRPAKQTLQIRRFVQIWLLIFVGFADISPASAGYAVFLDMTYQIWYTYNV